MKAPRSDLGLTTGSPYSCPDEIRELLTHIESFKEAETESVPLDKLHFTFLGITEQRFAEDAIPGNLVTLNKLARPFLEKAAPWIIIRPQLKWLGTALVLIGDVSPQMKPTAARILRRATEERVGSLFERKLRALSASTRDMAFDAASMSPQRNSREHRRINCTSTCT